MWFGIDILVSHLKDCFCLVVMSDEITIWFLLRLCGMLSRTLLQVWLWRTVLRLLFLVFLNFCAMILQLSYVVWVGGMDNTIFCWWFSRINWICSSTEKSSILRSCIYIYQHLIYCSTIRLFTFLWPFIMHHQQQTDTTQV